MDQSTDQLPAQTTSQKRGGSPSAHAPCYLGQMSPSEVEDNLKAMAKALIDRAKTQGFAVVTIGAAMGVSRQMVYDYASGAKVAPLPRLTSLAWALGERVYMGVLPADEYKVLVEHLRGEQEGDFPYAEKARALDGRRQLLLKRFMTLLPNADELALTALEAEIAERSARADYVEEVRNHLGDTEWYTTVTDPVTGELVSYHFKP